MTLFCRDGPLVVTGFYAAILKVKELGKRLHLGEPLLLKICPKELDENLPEGNIGFRNLNLEAKEKLQQTHSGWAGWPS